MSVAKTTIYENEKWTLAQHCDGVWVLKANEEMALNHNQKPEIYFDFKEISELKEILMEVHCD